MDKTKLNLERLRAYDAEWEEDKHPRAENGQFTSGSGSAGSSSGGSNTGGSSSASSTKKYNQKDLLKLANNHLNYHLGYNETDATADKVEIVSEPDEHGNVDAKVSYDVTVRIPYQETDWDGYTHTTYEEDSEYRTDIIPLNISDLKPEEPEAPKSPLRQAAETIKGKSTKAVPEFGSEKFHFDVSNYKTVVSGKDANTPEGEVHNSIIGMLETDNPTKYDIANAAFYLADEDYNDKVRHCREMIRKAKAQGKSKASQEWGEALIKANKQVTLLNAIGEAMRK